MALIRKCFSFFLGATFGIYIAQNYNVPNIQKIANAAMERTKYYEEKYRKPKKSEDSE